MQYQNAVSALRMAAQIAPAVLGWKPGGWLLYDPRQQVPDDVEPEIFIAGRGCLPVPLTETGSEVLASALVAITETCP